MNFYHFILPRRLRTNDDLNIRKNLRTASLNPIFKGFSKQVFPCQKPGLIYTTADTIT